MCAAGGIAQADPTPADGPRTTIDSDGTYSVGTEIAPGTYSSAGPVGESACYWKRLNGGDVVDNALSSKPQVVEIGPGDTAFKTDGCQPWQKLDCAASCLPAEADSTMWSVNYGDFLLRTNETVLTTHDNPFLSPNQSR